jgi:branched-chain amino acid transport system ATP-binding protein
MTTPVISLKDIETYYGEIKALKGVSLEVQAGEIVTLIGSNGAGKTTTLRTISGQLKPRVGSVFFNDQDITKIPPHAIASMGIAHVPEGRKIFPRLTVEENLEMGAFRIKNQARIQKSMKKAFELFPRLEERRKQKGGTLSGGEQQMLAMARALMSEPNILLLDEPSMGLAPLLVDLIFRVIKELNEEGMTILLVEQNALKALKIADRGYVLQTGSVVLSGEGEELLNNDLVKEAYLG